MFKQTLVCTSLIASMFTSSTIASGAEYGTVEEARAILGRAIAAVKVNKPEAITAFNRNDSRFRDRDLFVFCFNRQDGRFTAHEAMVNRDVRNLRDPNGKLFGMEMYNRALEERMTEIAFVSPLPGSTELTVKKAYVMRVGDQVCGVSAYQLNGNGSPTQ